MARKKADLNELAFQIMEAATRPAKEPAPKPRKKNPAAVALGRLGGLKGGKARAAKLSLSERKEIAKNAARIRWAKARKG